MEATEEAPSDDQDDDVARVLGERARRLASRRRERDEGELHLVAEVGHHAIAVPLDAARHVVAAPPLATLPGTGSAIAGLAVVLGELVPVADLASLLDGAGPAGPPGRWIVVIDDGDGQLGLLVDGVEGITTIGDEDPAVPDSPTRPSALVASVGPGGLLLLDLAALLVDARLLPVVPRPDQGES